MCCKFKAENQLKKDKHNLKLCYDYHMMWVDFKIANFMGYSFV